MPTTRFSLRTFALLFASAAMILALAVLVVRSAWWHDGVKPTAFVADEWRRADPIGRYRTSRSQMVSDLMNRYDFVGWSREEVVQLLGNPDAHPAEAGYEDWEVAYHVGLERGGAFSLDTEFLIFDLDDDDLVVAFRLVVN